ncbi:MAG TPA: heat-inducible transcription repressor HrcA [Lachnospiraceae bacterium]|nr:heat-inducible transcription repressor HrcA [Lachnospiraceae bacterium]
MEMELTDRKVKILEAIIRTYMETGEPVGSRTVSKYTDLNLSSATIRNEMADLEEMGYILQPHTSAGRIPSDKAYRMYVDSILQAKDKEVNDMQELLIDKADKIDLLLKQVAKLLAQNTNYTSMVTKPRYEHRRIKFIQLTRTGDDQILLLLVTQNNHVTNKFIQIDSDIPENDLAQLNFLLNTALNGLDVTEISIALASKIRSQAGDYEALAASILDTIARAMSDDDSEIYTSGATNILKYPELMDKEKMEGLLSTFEEKQMLTAWANDTPEDEDKEHAIRVYIGEESPIESMKDCSVVTATYKIEEGVYGKIGIVGPKRMDYEKVVGTLENCMQQLDDIFKNKEKALPDKSNTD